MKTNSTTLYSLVILYFSLLAAVSLLNVSLQFNESKKKRKSDLAQLIYLSQHLKTVLVTRFSIYSCLDQVSAMASVAI